MNNSDTAFVSIISIANVLICIGIALAGVGEGFGISDEQSELDYTSEVVRTASDFTGYLGTGL